LSRAAAAFRRLGRARVPLELAADALLAAGDLARARQWLEAAAAKDPARRAEISLPLADLDLLRRRPPPPAAPLRALPPHRAPAVRGGSPPGVPVPPPTRVAAPSRPPRCPPPFGPGPAPRSPAPRDISAPPAASSNPWAARPAPAPSAMRHATSPSASSSSGC